MTPNEFGGDWTDDKIDRLRRYLVEYVKIMQGKGFTTHYVDAFAGTGYRNEKRPAALASESVVLLPELAEPEAVELRKGSARVALEVEPSFDYYRFIEKSGRKCDGLRALVGEFPALERRARVVQRDANEYLQAWAKQMPGGHRAVVFLDPYGMQVEWATLEALAATKSVDLWLLFPLNVGVLRLLKRREVPTGSWADALTRTFGTDAWKESFYKKPEPMVQQVPLFAELEDEEEQGEVRVADWQAVGCFFIDRLSTIFHMVAPTTKLYRNSQNSPLYSLCFAAANPKGAPIAVRIAKYILETKQWRTSRRSSGRMQPGTP